MYLQPLLRMNQSGMKKQQSVPLVSVASTGGEWSCIPWHQMVWPDTYWTIWWRMGKNKQVLYFYTWVLYSQGPGSVSIIYCHILLFPTHIHVYPYIIDPEPHFQITYGKEHGLPTYFLFYLMSIIKKRYIILHHIHISSHLAYLFFQHCFQWELQE